MSVFVVTKEHFEIIRAGEYPTLVITKDQIDIILQAVNKYLLRMINLNTQRNWFLSNFTFVFGEKTCSWNSLTKSQINEVFNTYNLYTDREFKRMLQSVGIKTKICIGTLYNWTGERHSFTSRICWFNWVIFHIVTTCLKTMKKVGFDKMFDTQELAGFFNIPLYIDKYMIPTRTEKDFEANLSENELFKGLPYNNRTLFLDIYPNIKTMFYKLKNVLKVHDI